MDDQSSGFKSRKFLLTIGAFVVGIVLSYFGKLDQVTSDFIVYMTGAYLIGNVGADVTKILSNKKVAVKGVSDESKG